MKHQLRPVVAETLEVRLCLSFTFSDPIHSPLGETALLAVGEFTGDGRIDLIAKNASAATDPVRLFAGLGGGRFSTQGTPLAAGQNVSAIAAGDVNRDGQLDAIFTNALDQGTVTVLLGHGDGTFEAPASYFVGAQPSGLAIADFNNDQNPDIIVVNRRAWLWTDYTYPVGGPGLLLGVGDGTFEPVRRAFVVADAAGDLLNHVTAGDLNGDGNADAFFTGPNHSVMGPLLVTNGYSALGNGQAQFTRMQHGLNTGMAPQGVAASDLNGDGRDDIAVVFSNDFAQSDVVTYISGEGGVISRFATQRISVTRSRGISAADFDADGRMDLATVGGPATAGARAIVSILRGNGDGTVQPPQQFSAPGPALSHLVADVNGDQRPDIITGSATGVSTLLNLTSSGNFSLHRILLDLEDLAGAPAAM